MDQPLNYRANPLVMVHIADIHFGCIDPQRELQILFDQFLRKIEQIHFDILAIDGDLFDRKFAANNPAVQWAITFINYCVDICDRRNADLIIISGTESHDAGQLRLFYDLSVNPDHNVWIIDHIQFVHTHGVKILCIPEEYGKGSAYYEEYLSQDYDLCFLHGTLVGGVPNATVENLNSKREPVFSIESFSSCRGPIFAGHVHTHMNLQNDMYYISSPIRWRFGEEEDKGFMICMMDTNTYQYYPYFYPIISDQYITVTIDELGTTDPNEMIQKLEAMHANGANYIRLSCKGIPTYQLVLLKKYYHEMKNPYVKFYQTTRENPEQLVDASIDKDEFDKQFGELSFLMDDRIDELTKFVMYVNHTNGSDIISLDALKKVLSETSK